MTAVFTLWILVITVRYSRVVFQSIGSPFNEGRDGILFLLWLLAVAVLAVFAAAGKNRFTRAAPFVLVAVCLGITILSGTLFAALVTIWIFLLAGAWGGFVLRCFGTATDDVSDFVSISVPIGMVLRALAGLLLAAMHALTPVGIWILLLGITALRIRDFRRIIRPAAPDHLPLPLVIAAPVVVLNLMWAVAPEIQFDSNNYHLAVSKIYLQHGRFVDLPYFFHSYFYRLADMLFTIGLAVGGPASAKLISFGMRVVAALGVFTLGRTVFNPEIGYWAAAFSYTTAVVSWLSTTAYVDNIVAAFVTAALIAFLRGWYQPAGVLSGAAVAAKAERGLRAAHSFQRPYI